MPSARNSSAYFRGRSPFATSPSLLVMPGAELHFLMRLMARLNAGCPAPCYAPSTIGRVIMHRRYCCIAQRTCCEMPCRCSRTRRAGVVLRSRPRITNRACERHWKPGRRDCLCPGAACIVLGETFDPHNLLAANAMRQRRARIPRQSSTSTCTRHIPLEIAAELVPVTRSCSAGHATSRSSARRHCAAAVVSRVRDVQPRRPCRVRPAMVSG